MGECCAREKPAQTKSESKKKFDSALPTSRKNSKDLLDDKQNMSFQISPQKSEADIQKKRYLSDCFVSDLKEEINNNKNNIENNDNENNADISNENTEIQQIQELRLMIYQNCENNNAEIKNIQTKFLSLTLDEEIFQNLKQEIISFSKQLAGFQLHNFDQFDPIQFIINSKYLSESFEDQKINYRSFNQQQLIQINYQQQLNNFFVQTILEQANENQQQVLTEIKDEIWDTPDIKIIEPNIANLYEKVNKLNSEEFTSMNINETIENVLDLNYFDQIKEEEIKQNDKSADENDFEDNNMDEFDEQISDLNAFDQIQEPVQEQGDSKMEQFKQKFDCNQKDLKYLERLETKSEFNELIDVTEDYSTKLFEESSPIKRRQSLQILLTTTSYKTEIPKQEIIELQSNKTDYNKTTKCKSNVQLKSMLTPKIQKRKKIESQKQEAPPKQKYLSAAEQQKILNKQKALSQNAKMLLQQIGDLHQNYGYKFILKLNQQTGQLLIKVGGGYETVTQYIEKIQKINQKKALKNKNQDQTDQQFLSKLTQYVNQLEAEQIELKALKETSPIQYLYQAFENDTEKNQKPTFYQVNLQRQVSVKLDTNKRVKNKEVSYTLANSSSTNQNAKQRLSYQKNFIQKNIQQINRKSCGISRTKSNALSPLDSSYN